MPYVSLTPEEMADELGRLAQQLQAIGRTDLVLHALGVSMIEDLRLEAAKGRLLPLRITSDWRFFVGQREVELQPVHKAVYLLFLELCVPYSKQSHHVLQHINSLFSFFHCWE